MAKKLFSFPYSTDPALTDKIPALVGGANKVLTLATVKGAIIGTFADGVYSNVQMTVSGGKIISIEAGSIPPFIISVSTNIDFPEIPAGESRTETVEVAGAVTNDVVALGLPASAPSSILWTSWVSSTGVVSVRAFNNTLSPVDLGELTFRIKVIQ